MKRTTIFALLSLLSVTVFSQNINVLQNNYSQTTLSFSSPTLQAEEATLMGTPFSRITLDGFSTQSNVGMPALPTLLKTIEIPLGRGLSYEILSISCDTIDAATLGVSLPIIPAQPSRSKSDTKAPVLVLDSAAYASNSFCGAPTIVVEETGVARNRNLATIAFNPVSWNPATNQFAVVRNITVAVRQKNADIEATRRMKEIHACPAFGYGIETLNQLPVTGKEARRTAPIRYTIVAHSMFRGALDEFADWKRRKGFMVDLVYTDDQNVGSTTTSISRYLKSLYDNATEDEPAPTYVLLVGDVAQIPATVLTTNNSHYSDLDYVCWTLGDKLPDAYIGRFSAQSVDQLTPQISKTMLYEQYTFPDDSYLSKAVLIAGVDNGRSGDYGYSHADPTMDYVAYNYANSANGYTNITYYKNNTSRHPDGVTVTGSSQASGTAQTLRSLYNNGCGLVNYTAHGDKDMWANPEFSVTQVGQMTNQNKPFIAIGNCCLTNSFQIATCFGEALLRKDDNAGAVSYIGASEVTYWDEDVYWSMGPRSQISATMSTDYNAANIGMYDQLFHTHNESFDNWHITMGAILFAGNMAVQRSSSSATMKSYYWEVYHLMGDPSLMPYIHGPALTMTLTAPDNMALGENTINVHCVPYAYVAFTNPDHELMAAAYADANGDATLVIENGNEMAAGTYEIAATAQGYKIQFKPVTVTPLDTYVKATDMTPTGTVEAGKNVSFNVSLKNIGILPCDSLWIEFRNTDNKLLLNTTGRTALNQGLAVDQEVTLNGVCPAHVWEDLYDQENTAINVIVYWGRRADTRSSSRFQFPVNAVNVTTESHTLTRPMDTTNTAQLTIISNNGGHASLANATATLFSLDPTLAVTGSSDAFSIAAGSTISRDFTITYTDTGALNRAVPMLYTIESDSYRFTDSIIVIFGRPYEIIDFEDSTWGSISWTHGNYPWEITTYNPYEGNYCIRSKSWSGDAGDGRSSVANFSFTSTIDDSISFYYRVSSEESYDKLNFYIDNTIKMQASGEVGWTRAAFPIAAGSHTFRFSYSKDYYLASGEDAAYIDNLQLPSSAVTYLYLNDTICAGSEYTFADTTVYGDILGEGTHQITHTVGNTINYLTLTVLPAVQPSIEGGDITIRAGETARLTATGGSRYTWSSGEHHSIIDVYPTETTTYTVTAINGRCSAETSTVVTVEGTVAIEAIAGESNITIYPNPAHSQLNIKGDDIAEVVVMDIMGRVEKSHHCDGTLMTIDVSDLANGVHLIQTITRNGQKTVSKIIKK